MDVMESAVLPSIHIGIPDKFPPLDDDDLANIRKGMEFFSVFIDIVPHKHRADDEGFLGAIPNEALSSPYRDKKELQIGKGDWVIIDASHFKKMLLEFDSKRMMDGYQRFVKYLRSNPKVPRRQDDGMLVAETVTKALADLKACVVSASKESNALLFRILPPPG